MAMTYIVREMTTKDVASVVDYFVNADADYLYGMGAEKTRLPDRNEWIEKIKLELDKPYVQKEIYYLIWEVDGRPIGHTNINQIEFGIQANMHLHIWNKADRQGGVGSEMIRMSVPKYFEHFQLKVLLCEPYAQNPAPVKTLEQAGFEFIKTYKTTPGVICFPQMVKRYILTKERFLYLH